MTIKKRLKMMTKNKANAFSAYKIFLIMPVILFISFGLAYSQSTFQNGNEKRSEHNKNIKSDESDTTKEFPGVKTVDISTVSGNCQIMIGVDSLVKVSLTHHYKPAGTFEPIFEQEGDLLKLKENMLGANSGSSDWILLVPKQINIIFGSASGNISMHDITGKINIHTASGMINASNIKISESSEFTSASGSVQIRFSDSPKYDVLISSSSGVALIDFNQNPISGTIEMKTRTDRGEIECPLKFNTEKEELLGSQAYIVKSIVVTNEIPVIKIYTASGKAVLKK
jgi:hypothetical protein